MTVLRVKAAVLGAGGVALLIAGEPVPGAILATLACEALRVALARDARLRALMATPADLDEDDEDTGPGPSDDDDPPRRPPDPRPHATRRRPRHPATARRTARTRSAGAS